MRIVITQEAEHKWFAQPAGRGNWAQARGKSLAEALGQCVWERQSMLGDGDGLEIEVFSNGGPHELWSAEGELVYSSCERG